MHVGEPCLVSSRASLGNSEFEASPVLRNGGKGKGETLSCVAQLLECLCSAHTALGLLAEHGGVHLESQCAWEVDAGGPGIQGQPWLHSRFETDLGYKRLCRKNRVV